MARIEKHYINKPVNDVYETVVHKLTYALIEEGFEILTEYTVAHSNLRRHKILGACYPRAEDLDCTKLICKLTIEEHSEDRIKVSAIDPTNVIHLTKNANWGDFASYAKQKLQKVIIGL